MDLVLEVKNLTKIYPNGKVANNNINLSVKKGEIVGIIGPNGAGKSTLIRQILGLLKPTKGEISIFGQKPDEKVIKHFVGYVPQYPLNFPSLKVKEILSYILKLKGFSKKEISKKVSEYIEMFNLKKIEQYFGYQLSGGWSKLLLVAAAFIQEPEFLILDEPSNILDNVNKFNIWKIIKNSNKTVFYASHDMNEIKNLCDKVFILINGKIVAYGKPHEIAFFETLPVELKIVPEDEEIFKKIISGMNEIIDVKKGPMFKIAMKNLTDTIKFIAEVEKKAGIKYINFESPSFEKVIMKVLGGYNEKNN